VAGKGDPAPAAAQELLWASYQLGPKVDASGSVERVRVMNGMFMVPPLCVRHSV
jgi:hypothetical protein